MRLEFAFEVDDGVRPWLVLGHGRELVAVALGGEAELRRRLGWAE